MKKKMSGPEVNFAFLGTAPLARGVLDALAIRDFIPAGIIAGADRIDSRTKKIIEPVEKQWAREHDITVLQPQTPEELSSELAKGPWDLFVVASYGKILSGNILSIPKKGVLNVHPSLLPRLRGPSPIRSAILRDEKKTGVSIMRMDTKMDHGPLIAQREIAITAWPPKGSELDELLAREGGELLAQILPAWIAGEIEARPQNHDIATYSEKIEKQDGRLDLSADPYQNVLKIRAYEGWPGTFAYFERNGKKIRVSILDARLQNGELIIEKVKPEGKNEMSYGEFLRSGAKPLSPHPRNE